MLIDTCIRACVIQLDLSRYYNMHKLHPEKSVMLLTAQALSLALLSAALLWGRAAS